MLALWMFCRSGLNSAQISEAAPAGKKRRLRCTTFVKASLYISLTVGPAYHALKSCLLITSCNVILLVCHTLSCPYEDLMRERHPTAECRSLMQGPEPVYAGSGSKYCFLIPW